MFFRAGDVFEIRALNATTPGYRHEHTESGYFDYEHIEDVPKALENISARGVYVTPNPVSPALLARSANRMKAAGKDSTTSDADIVSRRWLLIDCDPVRPSGISATDEEHDSALYKALEISEGLKSMGWTSPLFLDSGNGAQLMYCIYLPTDDSGLIQACLKALSSVNDEKVHIDQSVHNPARIWRLPGTWNRKGDEVENRIFRIAKIIEAPENLEIVTIEKLKELAGDSLKAEPSIQSASDSFNLDDWIAKYCPEAEGPSAWKDGRKWVFSVCPFNPEHNNRSAVITQQSNGAIGFKCHHNGCKDYDWHALRRLKEPEFQALPVIFPEVDISGIMVQMKRPKSEWLPIPVNAARWLKEELPPPVPIVENIIDKGNKVQIIGDSKLGKSWFNLNLAVAIATGRNFLNWKIPAARKVLLVQMEIGGVYYQKRLRFVAESMNIQWAALDKLEIINGRGLPPLLEGNIFSELLEIASAYDVIFIDPLYKVHSGDENKADDMKKPLLAFDMICEMSGAAVVYTHHNQKGLSGDRKLVDRGSGSGIMARDYDTMISLSPHVQEGLIVLDTLTRNYLSPQPLSLQQDGTFRIINIAPEELTSQTVGDKKKMTMIEAMMLSRNSGVIKYGEELKAEELDDRLVSICGLPIRMARTVRTEMVDQGEWVICSGNKNAKVYRLKGR